MVAGGCSRNPNCRRTAAAVIELAVCLPAIIVLVLAAIECCSMIFVTQSIHVAAYEGARLAVQRTSDSGQVIAHTEQILSAHDVTGAVVHCEPAEVADAEIGSPVVVVVTVPADANRVSPFWFFDNRTLEARITMARE